jgi:ABC-2 type transport system permease protein
MLIGAIKNELEKLYRKKRIHVIIGILIFFSTLMMVIDYFDKDSQKVSNWEAPLEIQLNEMNNYLNTMQDKQSDEYKNLLNQSNKLEYQLTNDINPVVEGAAGSAISSVSGMFVKIILPILIVIVTADIIAGEASNGTLKSLLVSPLGRKNILFSKWIAATIVSIGAMLFSDILTYLTAIPLNGLGNWNDLIVVGTDTFRSIPIWQYMIQGLLLNILMIITLTSVFIMVSVLFETVTTSISLSICIVVFGGILTGLQDKLDLLKYFFILNLDLVSHLTGEFDLQNTSLLFSTVVMGGTLFLALCASFSVFSKKDMLV